MSHDNYGCSGCKAVSTKLCCHNFTIYNVVNNQVVCYWFNENVANGQASVYPSE